MKRLLAIALCLCLTLSGCGISVSHNPTGNGPASNSPTGPATPGQTDQSQSLSLAYYAEKGLNPYICADFTNRALFSLIYQSLFSIDREYKVEPHLCKSYSVSQDMKTYTFYLEDATFSDGSPVTAADAVASLNAAKDNIVYQGRFLHVESITLSADGGVTVNLKVPYENLLTLLDIPIVPASQVAEDWPLGSGPYYLYTATGGMSLRRRSNWWCQAELPLDTTSIALVPAESITHIRDQFEFSGLSLSCTDPGSDRFADYRCDYELWDCESGIFLYLAPSANSTVFANDTLRASLTYAIDRDLLASEYYRDFARSATLPASPASPYYNNILAQRYAYNQEKFAQAVTESGHEGSEIVFLVSTDDSLRLRVARRIGKMLEAGGLKVTMKELSGSAYTAALQAQEFDIYLGQTRLSPNMDLSSFFTGSQDLSWGGMDDVGAYALCLQALENHGNYFTLHKQIMDRGLLCPILFRNYAIYTARGITDSLAPARDNLFCYSLGKTLADAKIIPEN